MLNTFVVPFHIPGTLSADLGIRFQLPLDVSLLAVSAVASNDSDATLKIGTSADDDAYLTAGTIGDSGTPAVKDRDDFVGTQYPHIAAGTVVVLTLDHDGAGGTAAANVTIALTLSGG